MWLKVSGYDQGSTQKKTEMCRFFLLVFSKLEHLAADGSPSSGADPGVV